MLWRISDKLRNNNTWISMWIQIYIFHADPDPRGLSVMSKFQLPLPGSRISWITWIFVGLRARNEYFYNSQVVRTFKIYNIPSKVQIWIWVRRHGPYHSDPSGTLFFLIQLSSRHFSYQHHLFSWLLIINKEWWSLRCDWRRRRRRWTTWREPRGWRRYRSSRNSTKFSSQRESRY